MMPASPRSTPRVTRRRFLAIGGMVALGSGLSCLGGLLGYLAVDQLRARNTRAPSPSPVTQQPLNVRLKQIDRPAILTRQDWGALAPNHDAPNESGFFSASNPEGWMNYQGDLRAVYRTVVVHHSVIVEADDLATMREIQRQHMELRGWADIAYHFGVGRNGEVFEGRALGARGTHVEHFNTGSLGVVFLGNFAITAPEPAQIEAGRRLINWLALRLELTHLAGHHDFNDYTDCPGQYMLPYLAMLAESAGLALGTDGYQPPTLTPTPAPVYG